MSDDGAHKPGDIVNGHILGSDNQWHPLMSGASDQPIRSDAAASPVESGIPTSAQPHGDAAGPSVSIGPDSATVTGNPLGTTQDAVRTKSGWRGLSRGKKAGIVGAAAVGLLLVAGLAGGSGQDSQTTPQSTGAEASASPAGAPSAMRSASPASTPDPDVATFWAKLSPDEQQKRCALYRGSDPASAVDGLTYNTSNTKDVVRAHLEQVCPVPPPPPPKNYAALDERTWQLIAKDPDAYAGQTFLVFGEVTQFDAATGDDAFRADVAHTNTCSYGFFDGDNTLLTAGPGVSLANVVKDDVFAAQVTVVGSMSYDTQIGGNTTVPLLQVDSIEVQPSRCDV